MGRSAKTEPRLIVLSYNGNAEKERGLSDVFVVLILIIGNCILKWEFNAQDTTFRPIGPNVVMSI